MKWLGYVGAAMLLLAGWWAGGCSAGGAAGFGTGTATASAGGHGASTGGEGGIGGLFNEGGAGCGEELTCSTDLSAVLCGTAVFQNCEAGQMCAGGQCLPACEAAEVNQSTVGCRYYTANPDVTWSAGACFAAFVANTWNEPVTISVSFAGTSLDVGTFARIPSGNGQAVTYQPLPGGQLPPGEIAILFLADYGTQQMYTPMCPAGITPAVSTEDAALHGTGIGRSFYVETSAPVVAYDIFPYGGGWSAITSATLLIPVSAWGDNYIAVQPYGHTYSTSTSYSWVQIIASENDTSVTILPTAAIVAGGTVAGSPAGQPATYALQQGQVLQFTQDEILTGSPIQADKPVAVVGGNRCMNIPMGASACDAGHQMLPPVGALGHEYVAVRYRDRSPTQTEAPPWRIVGAVDGTQLTYEPATPAGAPTTIDSCQVVEFTSPGPFVVRSQGETHPFYVSAHMPGCSTVVGGNGCPGDPETVNVVPPEQFLGEYVFFTDPTYPETNLVFVRQRTADGFLDVELDCAGTLTGWQAINADYEFTRVDLVTGDFVPQGGCDNGRHEATSEGPFGITIWGWGSSVTGGSIDPNASVPGFYSEYVSYAYPAGAGVKVITQVEVPPIPN